MLKSGGELEEIDALLGCPILMFSPDLCDTLSTLSSKVFWNVTEMEILVAILNNNFD